MGVRKEQVFLSEHFPGDITKCIHSASNTVERNNGREARNEFISFCNEAFEKTDAGFDIIDPIHCKCTQWQNSRYIMCYMWYPFMRHEARDDFCCVSFAMEKFYDGDYKLMMKFEINDEGMDDEASFDRFRKVVEDLRPEGMQYVIYPNSGIADKDGEEDGERFMGFDAALEKYNNIRDKKQKKKKRICPAALIADSDDMDDDELMFERTAKAIDELSKYYDAYYDGLTAGGPHGSGEKKENGTEKRTMKEIPKNVILYGPPGTGKTYSTVIKALEIIEGEPGKYEKVSYDTYKDELFPSYKDNVRKGRIKFVTFHQSYGYEEFIEGIRPSTDVNGNIRYDVEDGVFKKFCDTARKGMGEDESRDLPYVFIIDEINRGNISKIFGELITLIEDNKREGEKETAKALLPYPKKDENGKETEDYFSVPRNVYIIGTMNTADRSITSIDTALRRRFVFEEMMPRPELLDGIEVDGINIRRMLEAMNERIEFLYDREHQIGHAYFMGLKADHSTDNLADIFGNKIIPLLQEYFFDDYEKIGLVLGDNRLWAKKEKSEEDEEKQFIIREEKKAKDLFGDCEDLEESRFVYRVNGETPRAAEAYTKIYEGVGETK